MRRTLSLALVPALLLGLMQAPLAHMHRHDPEHRHASGLAHTHIHSLLHQSQAPHDVSSDDDVQTLDWVALLRDSAPPFAAVVNESIPLPLLEQVCALGQTPSPRGHDPPVLRSPGSRAPPA